MNLDNIRLLSDAELHALAVQVRVWMLSSETAPWSVRRQLVTLLSRVGDAFGERGWSRGSAKRGVNRTNQNFPPGSRWARVHDEARRRVAKEPVRDVAREMAAWLGRKPVAA